MNIGKRFRELRQAKKLSQGDLEGLAGLHCSYISRVEGGHSVPALHTLERFAAALDIEMSQLFSKSGTGSPGSKRKGKVPHDRAVKLLLRLFRHLSTPDRRLVLLVARDLVVGMSKASKRVTGSYLSQTR